MTDLRAALEQYLRVRRGLGYKLERPGRLLDDFVTFCERAGTSTLTTDAALAWATLPANGDGGWWAQRLGAVRGFAAYLQALDPATEVPPAGLLPGRSSRAAPYLYSDADIAGLMAAARDLASPLRASTYETLVGLLAVTGMRIGEAIKLDRADVCWEEGLLRVNHSKFGESRQLPLHTSTVDALRAYARRRDELCRTPKDPSFFVSIAGTRLLYRNAQSVFAGLTCRAGLARRSQRCRPRLHDLRHTFAMRTLMGWYAADVEVQARLPLLSTYLGHTEPKWTYWYLSATPELLAMAGKRLANAQGELG